MGDPDSAAAAMTPSPATDMSTGTARAMSPDVADAGTSGGAAISMAVFTVGRR